MKIDLLSITQNCELLIESAGRTCYDSSENITKESSNKFIKMLVKNGHESVLEHASAVFRISGISRACSHQLVRYRLASYSQRSQRYCKEDNFEYVIPEKIKNNQNLMTKFTNIMYHIDKEYKSLLLNGIKPEDARYILPNACSTEIVVTMNFRELRHFIKQRISKKAQWEIRELAENILDVLLDHAPNVFGDIYKEE